MIRLLLFLAFVPTAVVTAQKGKISDIENAVELFRSALINADSSLLDMLVDERLSYGHSNGIIDSKSAFINKLLSGQSDFVSINQSEQKIVVYKKTAVVHHQMYATTNDHGIKGEVTLSVLQVWLRKNGIWRLITRQAVKRTL